MTTGASDTTAAKNVIYGLCIALVIIGLMSVSYFHYHSLYPHGFVHQSPDVPQSSSARQLPSESNEFIPDSQHSTHGGTQMESQQAGNPSQANAETPDAGQRTLLGRADDAYSQGDYSDAEALYEAASQEDPDSVVGRVATSKLNQMMAAIARRRPKPSADYQESPGFVSQSGTAGGLSMSVAQSLRYAATQNQLGDAFMRRGRLQDARAAYSRAVATAPTSTEGEYANSRIKQINAQLGVH